MVMHLSAGWYICKPTAPGYAILVNHWMYVPPTNITYQSLISIHNQHIDAGCMYQLYMKRFRLECFLLSGLQSVSSMVYYGKRA